MSFSLVLPLYFEDDLESLDFEVVVGLSSSIKLPKVIQSEGIELKEVILMTNDNQLAEYFSYNKETNEIIFAANGISQGQDFNRRLEDDVINQFLGINVLSLILVNSYGDEYVYDLSVTITLCQFSAPGTLTGPFSYSYYSDQVPNVLAMFENEKASP